ncbi:NTP transferase domain-containing protein [Subtercola sp. PAMC28395]|uniref:DUF6457 domain-containing protein n=1 Tax=Subtercola sp. PAMC28395 TaxID=2846775 RepID=UPI001C0C5045|nr:DUF6457 domain-containing protein [Subtercola sp. PAMC28395]QWT24135.1 NTP transferase domain-containing protein [Subtercola sp. PAMC28395]
MDFDCVVLAGGRSSRLNGYPKPSITVAGSSLLDRTLAAATDARQTVIVADPSTVPHVPGTLLVRENPPFSGPASALAAGLHALQQNTARPSEYTLVLACDMPGVGSAVQQLLRAAGGTCDATTEARNDGLIAIDGSGHPQHLLGLYRTAALISAITAAGGGPDASKGVAGLSMRSLLGPLTLKPVHLHDDSSDDIDTWADALRFRAQPGGPPRRSADPADHATDHAGTARSHVMSTPAVPSEGTDAGGTDVGGTDAGGTDAPKQADDQSAVLARWAQALCAELELGETPVDIDTILSLAGTAAHAVTRPAAPLTTYLVGFAAGRAAAQGTDVAEAFTGASDAARTLAESWAPPSDEPDASR